MSIYSMEEWIQHQAEHFSALPKPVQQESRMRFKKDHRGIYTVKLCDDDSEDSDTSDDSDTDEAQIMEVFDAANSSGEEIEIDGQIFTFNPKFKGKPSNANKKNFRRFKKFLRKQKSKGN